MCVSLILQLSTVLINALPLNKYTVLRIMIWFTIVLVTHLYITPWLHRLQSLRRSKKKCLSKPPKTCTQHIIHWRTGKREKNTARMEIKNFYTPPIFCLPSSVCAPIYVPDCFRFAMFCCAFISNRLSLSMYNIFFFNFVIVSFYFSHKLTLIIIMQIQ